MRRSFLAAFVPAAFVALAACAAPAEPSPEVSTSTANEDTCPPSEHECPAWGAVCNGDTLTTCVLDARGCRKKIEEPCALGCAAGACKTCSAFTSPVDATLAPALPAFYRDLTLVDATTAVAIDEGRDGIYSKPRRALAWFRVPASGAPSLLASTPLPDNTWVRSVRSAGGKLVALVGGDLRVWSAPAAAPASVQLGGASKALAVEGTLAFVGDDTGVTVVDVGVTPPVVRGVVATTIPAHGLAAAAGRLAVAGGTAVEIYDLADPAAPALLAKATRAAKIYDANDGDGLVAFDGTRVYAPGSIWNNFYFVETLDVFELDAAAAPPVLRPRGALRVAPPRTVSLVAGELVGRRGTRVGTLDLANPDAPAWNRMVTLPVEPRAVVRRGDHLYAASTEGLTSIALPKASSVRFTPRAEKDVEWAVARKGSLAYVARAEGGFSVEDLRDPKAPKVLSQTKTKTGGLALEGNLAYVSTIDALRIYDVRNPAAPALVGSVAAPGKSVGLVHVAGNRAFAVCGSGDVCVFDVTTPSTPTFVGVKSSALAVPGGMSWAPFAMSGSRLYIATPLSVVAFDLGGPGAQAAKVSELPLELVGHYSPYGYGDAKVGVDGARGVVAYECGVPMDRKVCMDVLDLASPAGLQKRGSIAPHRVETGAETYRTYNPGATVLRAEVHGSRAYAFLNYGGVLVVDLASPDAPKDLGERTTVLPGSLAHESGTHLTVHGGQFAWPGRNEGMRVDEVTEVCK